jgi:hypothetical protein
MKRVNGFGEVLIEISPIWVMPADLPPANRPIENRFGCIVSEMQDRNLDQQKGNLTMILIMALLVVVALIVAITLYDHFKSK